MIKKDFVLGAIGYGIIVAYWILGIIFCTFISVMHWINYLTIGETTNHMSFALLIFCTVAVSVGWLLTGLGTCIYIKHIKMYRVKL